MTGSIVLPRLGKASWEFVGEGTRNSKPYKQLVIKSTKTDSERKTREISIWMQHIDTIVLSPNARELRINYGYESQTLCFDNEVDVSTFLGCVEESICLSHLAGNPSVFVVNRMKATSGTIKKLESTIPRVDETMVGLNDILVGGLVGETTLTTKKFGLDEYNRLIDEYGRLRSVEYMSLFMSADVDVAVAGRVWRILLNIGERLKSSEERRADDEMKVGLYIERKRMWTTMTDGLMQMPLELSEMIEQRRKEIACHEKSFSGFRNAKVIMEMVFNVLVTWSNVNWTYAADGSVSAMIMPFVRAFVADANAETRMATRPDSTEASMDTVESEIFEIFSAFCKEVHYERSPRQGVQTIGVIIEQHFPGLLRLLNAKHARSVDYLVDDYDVWFVNMFTSVDLERIWMSALSTATPYLFFQAFVIALLVSLSPKLIVLNFPNAGEFVRRFHLMKKKVDINTLLFNTEAVLYMLSLSNTTV